MSVEGATRAVHTRCEPARVDAGSFRDPGGRVYIRDGRIFRTVNDSLADDYTWVVQSGLFQRLAHSGQLVRTREADEAERAGLPADAFRILECERIPFVTYPYEWPFAALQRAALFHLDLQLDVLRQGGTLVDASAYNVQFRGPQPVFIDVLSLRRYREGEIWAGHRQFCEQFLNPLVLGAFLGVAHHAWYRGCLEGIPGHALAALLRARHKLSWNVLTHIVLPNRLQDMASGRQGRVAAASSATLPKTALVAMLRGLRRFIARLHPAYSRRSEWLDYASTTTYSSDEMTRKQQLVRDFIAQCQAATVLDLGCNTGNFAAAALEAGAKAVIGLESDPATADRAFARATAERINFLPLVVDAANPSPSQGWRAAERAGFAERAAFDAVIALAFEHHLAIGRNVPLDELIGWIVGLAPQGLIEFVPKEDPTVQRMLMLRQDVFPEYTEAAFTALLRRHARITAQERVSASGRMVFRFERD